jgi:DNA-binding beta-propeller fold protein YncE
VQHALVGFDLGTGQARELARFPAGYYARDLRVVGTRVGIWLVPVTGVMIDGKPRDVPQVVVIDAASGATVATLRLPDLRAGYVPDASTPLDPNRDVEPGLAWDTPRARLYIADAESDRIYTLDLRAGTVRSAEPRPRRSMLDVLWSLLAQPAEAKLMNSTRQQAAVSPDGSRLYVSGQKSDFVKGQDGKLHEVVTPIQLRTIDTADMAELGRLDAASTALWVAPDGTRLLYGTERVDGSVEDWATRSDFKLHVMDAAAPRDVATLAWPGPISAPTFDAQTGIAYMAAQPYGDITGGHATIFAVGIASGELRARRALDRHFADVLVLRAR